MQKRIRIAKLISTIPVEKWCKWASNWVHSNVRMKILNMLSLLLRQHQFFREMYVKENYFAPGIKVFGRGRTLKISSDYDNYLKNFI